MNTKDADDLISKDEFQFIYKRLSEINKTIAILYQTAYFTGMRFNEIFSLPMDCLFKGEIDDIAFSKSLKSHDINYYGYIVLESQSSERSRRREADGTIKRKPLKSRKKISEKNNRLIPIIDKSLFNNLVELYKKQKKLLDNGQYGSDQKNYVLFDEVNATECSRILKKSYEHSNYKYKSYHCLRHTRCTELVGATRDFILARYWLGHARQEVTERYTHIFQQSARAAKKKTQKLDFID